MNRFVTRPLLHLCFGGCRYFIKDQINFSKSIGWYINDTNQLVKLVL